MAKDAVNSQSSARDWGREAIRLIVEEGRSVESVITETKDALAWHYNGGILDTLAKKSKFNNYFSTIRYLIPGWASGSISMETRDEVLSGATSFLWVYAHQKKREKADISSFENAIENIARIKSYAIDASPENALRLKQEISILIDILNQRL